MSKDPAPSFEILREPTAPEKPVVVHLPHASTRIPAEWRPDLVLDPPALARELLAMTDRHTDDLFAPALALGATLFINRVSRLVMDPERFPDDDDEPMAEVGMGAIYTRTSEGAPLRSAEDFSPARREETMGALFRPYARALAELVDEKLARFGSCLIIDGHSYPSVPLRYEDPELARPQLCIGYEPFHCDAELVARVRGAAERAGYEVRENEPFPGSYVPLAHYGKNALVQSVMLEVRRDLYMDERTGEKLPGFGLQRDRLAEVVRSALGG